VDPSVLLSRPTTTHIFPDELGDGAGQHEAGDRAGHDVEEGVHDPRGGRRLDRRAEGAAQGARRRTTAAAYLRGERQRQRERERETWIYLNHVFPFMRMQTSTIHLSVYGQTKVWSVYVCTYIKPLKNMLGVVIAH